MLPNRAPPSASLSGSQKPAQQVEKPVEPVVVHPMPGDVERDDAGVAEMADAAVLLRVRGPALLAVDEEGRAGDARPQILGFGLGHAVGPVGADVIVEFPAVAAVLVLVDPVLGQ